MSERMDPEQGEKTIGDLELEAERAEGVKGGRAIDDINNGAVNDLRDIVKKG